MAIMKIAFATDVRHEEKILASHSRRADLPEVDVRNAGP